MTSYLEKLEFNTEKTYSIISPQIFDSQLCDFVTLEKITKRATDAHISLLLLLFPSILVNTAFIEESSIIDQLTDNELGFIFGHGHLILLTNAIKRDSTETKLSWELIEDATKKRTKTAKPALYDCAVKRLSRIKKLDTRIWYIDVGSLPLAEKFRDRLIKIHASLTEVSDTNRVVDGIADYCSPSDFGQFSRNLKSIASFENLSRRLIYNEFKFEDDIEKRIITIDRRLLKAAVDISYTSNAPTQLGVPTAYSRVNRPFEIARLKPARTANKQVEIKFSPPNVQIKSPHNINDAISLLKRKGKHGDPETPLQISSDEEWWENFQRCCKDLDLSKEPNLDIGMIHTIDQMKISGIRIETDNDTEPAQISIAFPRLECDSCSNMDFQVLSEYTKNESIISMTEN